MQKETGVMLQQDNPDDYVISSGSTHSIKEFLTLSFNEIGINDWSSYVKQDQRFMRPAEVDVLLGDSTKAHKKLGWSPKTSFKQLVKIMIENDLNILDNKNKTQ